MSSDWLLAGVGLAVLLLAGDALVKGAVNLSLRLGVSAVIVSLTVVAFGTSAPELLVAIQAVAKDAPGIALGNVVGSNTANILLVLGLPALISGMNLAGSDFRKSYLVMLGVSVVFIAFALTGTLDRWQGAVLLALLAAVLFDQFRALRADRAARARVAEPEGANPAMPGWRIGVFLVLGLVGLPLGADILVDSGSRIARDFGLSETVIGLTLIALGTSLPELATTAMAAIRRNADVALGNVLGSNLFNLAGIAGITSLIAPIAVDPAFLRQDIWVMLGSSVLIAPFILWRRDMNRLVGAGLCGLYAGYVILLLT
ncbi:MAG: calcium/sodium antiporter [Qingshengfaniella sp.]